jgi:lysozyme
MAAALIIGGILAVVALAIYGNVQVQASDSASGDTSGTDNLNQDLNFSLNVAPAGSAGDPLSIAIPLIKGFEKFSATAYEDPPGSGKYSIGYGHQITGNDPYTRGSVIGESEAEDLLHVDAGTAWVCVYQNVTPALSPQQYAALISFVFNEGCQAFKSSTLLQDLNNGDTAGAAAQFLVWNKEHVNGQLVTSDTLTARREQEQALFQGDGEYA